MTQHTARDYIWATALERREEDVERFGHTSPLELDAPTVREELPEEIDPSDRTIRDVLATMRDLGELENATTAGADKPGAYVRPD